MKILPLGVDCTLANYLHARNLRQASYPFDWTVTYFGVDRIIRKRFENFLPESAENRTECVYFMHDVFPQDCEKYARRTERFLDDLNCSELCLIRIGHSEHHHFEIENLKDYKQGSCSLRETSQMHAVISAIKEINSLVKIHAWLFLTCRECYEIGGSNCLRVHDISKKMPKYEKDNFDNFLKMREATIHEEMDELFLNDFKQRF